MSGVCYRVVGSGFKVQVLNLVCSPPEAPKSHSCTSGSNRHLGSSSHDKQTARWLELGSWPSHASAFRKIQSPEPNPELSQALHPKP